MRSFAASALLAVAWTMAPAAQAAARPVLGVTSGLWAATPAEITARLDRAGSLGARMIRWDAPWKAVELQKGVLAIPPSFDRAVDEARKRGIEPLLILDYGNPYYDGGLRPTSPAAIQAYTNYAEAIVRHFKGRVKFYEIWNEWNENNGGAGYGSPEEYVRLVRAVYPAVKRIAPEATFLVGATSRVGTDSFNIAHNYLMDRKKYHFLEDFLTMKGMAYGDALSIHPYVREEATDAEKIASYNRMLTNITAGLAATGRSVPLFVTEVGWGTAPVSDGHNVTEADQGALLKQIVQASCRFPNVRAVIFYALDDSGTNNTYGLFGNHGRAKPAAIAFQDKNTACR